MSLFLDKVEKFSIKYLTKRKALKIYKKEHPVKRTFWGEVKGWVDALVFAVVVILLLNQYIFQLFVIPTPSMEKTMLVGDRVFVNKNVYGLEVWPGGIKLGSNNRVVRRDNIITFYNPEYESKGPLFDVAAQMLFSATFSLVNIDKNEDGTPAERLYVKRAAAMNNDTVRFVDGNVEIRVSGSDEFVNEMDYREANELSLGPNRLIDDSYYSGLNAWAALVAYRDKNLSNSTYTPSYYMNDYSELTDTNYPKDMYQFMKIKNYTEYKIDPSDFSSRSSFNQFDNGITVPDNYVLPLGDNRDNSRDGRYFGPVSQDTIIGRVFFRFWPLNRISYLGNQ
ncbi:MAG: signal peptidase I [Pleomorphochaeta sp.]